MKVSHYAKVIHGQKLYNLIAHKFTSFEDVKAREDFWIYLVLIIENGYLVIRKVDDEYETACVRTDGRWMTHVEGVKTILMSVLQGKSIKEVAKGYFPSLYQLVVRDWLLLKGANSNSVYDVDAIRYFRVRV